MSDIDSIGEAPWRRCDWTGSIVSVDGAPDHDFTIDDVDHIVAYASTPRDEYDGKTVGVAALKDGRFIAWESWWDATGSGFCNDAYGGTADILVGATADVVRDRLSIEAREMLDGSS